jgi:hypothetical protein
MKALLLFIGKFAVGVVAMALFFAIIILAINWALGFYNQYRFAQRIKGENQASNKIYYVSLSGNDSNNGLSEKEAWRTITKINQTDFLPGDQILLEGGKEFIGNIKFDDNDIGTPANPIKISSYGEGRAIIKAENLNGIEICKRGRLIALRVNSLRRSSSIIKFISSLPKGSIMFIKSILSFQKLRFHTRHREL